MLTTLYWKAESAAGNISKTENYGNLSDSNQRTDVGRKRAAGDYESVARNSNIY
jgi:hypothetical protein